MVRCEWRIIPRHRYELLTYSMLVHQSDELGFGQQIGPGRDTVDHVNGGGSERLTLSVHVDLFGRPLFVRVHVQVVGCHDLKAASYELNGGISYDFARISILKDGSTYRHYYFFIVHVYFDHRFESFGIFGDAGEKSSYNELVHFTLITAQSVRMFGRMDRRMSLVRFFTLPRVDSVLKDIIRELCNERRCSSCIRSPVFDSNNALYTYDPIDYHSFGLRLEQTNTYCWEIYSFRSSDS